MLSRFRAGMEDVTRECSVNSSHPECSTSAVVRLGVADTGTYLGGSVALLQTCVCRQDAGLQGAASINGAMLEEDIPYQVM